MRSEIPENRQQTQGDKQERSIDKFQSDVASELGKPKNPIRRIIESVESLIKESELDTIKSEIVQLNTSISKVEQVELVGRKIKEKNYHFKWKRINWYNKMHLWL